ncbi:MAG: aminomethyltransferase [Gaiellales bacterium]|nr:aminomethyltransferase [Gaiellales bacterium]
MGGATLTRTAFDAVQRAIPGARFAQWRGWEWIAGFGDDPASEHRAVRTGCGIWDKSPLQKWLLTGPQALTAADRFFTNDMRSLRPGQVRYGAFCDDDGRMLGDGTVFALAADSCWVITAVPSDGDALCEAADGLEFEIRNITADAPNVQLQGPESRSVLQSLTTHDLASLRYYQCTPEPVDVAGEPVWVARCGYSGELGYELYCRAQSAERLWTAVLETGRVRPYGLDAVETLRQESGLIFIDRDYLVGETDPYEVNLDRVIRLEKPEFRGQAALRRIAEAPARRLTTLLVEGDEVPVHGAGLTAGSRRVGEVRSACFSPTLVRVIALAAIESGRIEPGARFGVELEGGSETPGELGSHPAYDPQKLRPRA